MVHHRARSPSRSRSTHPPPPPRAPSRATRSASTGTPLPGAQLRIPPLNLAALADPSGHYEITDIPAGTHTLEISLIGHTTETREVTIADGRSVHLDIELHESAIALEGLVALGSRARPRTATRSAVPIDAITGRDFVEQGDTDLNDLLRTVIPPYT